MKSLRQVLQICDVTHIRPGFDDILITDIFLDSRKCMPGSCFCAYKGMDVDGHDYIKSAVNNGAVAVLAEQPNESCPIPLIVVDDLKSKMGRLAAEFYDQPSSQLTLIGVTGTNGKTSVTQFIANCLKQLGKPCGVIGTMGYGRIDNLINTGATTPSMFEVRRILKTFTNDMCEAVTMEVSSHALSQHRADGLHFDMAIFTNLTHDHLDYHKTMEAYAQAKAKLFACNHLKFAIFNADDPASSVMKEALGEHVSIMNYGMHNQEAEVHLLDVQLLENGMQASIQTPKGRIDCNVPLLGLFNLENILATISALILLGYPIESIRLTIERLSPVEGRMEIIENPDAANIIIDYAHTPDALSKVLTSCRAHTQGKIFCVFGCGGGRDKTKRKIMAEISERLSDFTIITEDNSRNEPLPQILSDIEKGFSRKDSYQKIESRKTAIQTAIQMAKPSDLIILAGKGHERYLDIQGEHIPFDERLIIQESLC